MKNQKQKWQKNSADIKRMTTLSAIVSVAMILSYIESLIPAFVAVPGVKVGLSNIATVFALYSLGPVSAVVVSIVRVCLSSLLFGNPVMLVYSLFGAIFALATMLLLRMTKLFSVVGISVAGAVMHNAGQTLAACLMMENSAISIYLAPLAISGTIAGVVIGLISGLLIEKLKKHLKL